MNRFAKYSWIVLAYTVAVILWGAYVRATGAGAGCGAHWPLCNGQIVPRAAQVEELIEYSHRISSGLSGLLVLVLLIGALRLYPKGHIVCQGAWLSIFFMLTEGAVGAGLVLFELVAHNASEARAAATAVHFTNTLFLLTALTLTAWWASGGKQLHWQNQDQRSWLLIIGMLGLLILGVSGAITALGDTLFPAASLREGIQQDFETTAHFLIQLRIWHPVIAVAVAVYLWVISHYLAGENGQLAKPFTTNLKVLVAIQLAAGMVNVLLLAPVWMQIIHLLLADLVLIQFVLLAAVILAQPDSVGEAKRLAAHSRA